jgi:hypothetical protein
MTDDPANPRSEDGSASSLDPLVRGRLRLIPATRKGGLEAAGNEPFG